MRLYCPWCAYPLRERQDNGSGCFECMNCNTIVEEAEAFDSESKVLDQFMARRVFTSPLSRDQAIEIAVPGLPISIISVEHAMALAGYLLAATIGEGDAPRHYIADLSADPSAFHPAKSFEAIVDAMADWERKKHSKGA